MSKRSRHHQRAEQASKLARDNCSTASAVAGWPRDVAAQGSTPDLQWACCTSSIGPVCGHKAEVTPARDAIDWRFR